MKTFYWSLVLMLLPSMAYTQTTEKENEFSMSMQIRPRAEYRNGALFPRLEGRKLHHLLITVPGCRWITNVRI